jgi:hypothetical protein
MTPQQVADAMLARDFDALGEGFAPDVVLHSPITGLFRFEGREEVLALLRVVRETVADLEYPHAFGSGDEGTLIFRARLGKLELEGSDLMRFDEQGRVREFRVFIRPLPALAALAGALAPALARRRSRARALLLRLLLAPLVIVIRAGDALGVRLVEPAIRRPADS